jgi:beta-lactam-binding protein with PASTA domain/predicted Ser/Thr protein kinase
VLEGRYRVLERLARGGMSTVYRALDERLDRPVAVKVMSAALSSDPAFADRFAREARVAAKLSHLNAVAVYDQGTDGEHVFLVMELVRGRTLRDLLRERGVLSPAQAVSIMEPVLGALAAAHRAGLVHRDVKPENILLSDDGAVKVADFGLARAIEADASSTRTGLMMGTVAYCPPEQIARGSADARSDVYSAGIVLFELLTGAPPYTGDSAMAVAYQHVHSDVPPPSSRRAGIPRQLDEIVLRATSREQSGRPLDAGALLAELHDTRVDLGLPVVAVPPRRPAAGELADTQQINRVPAHPSVPPYPPPATGGGPAGSRPRGAEAPTAPTHGNAYRAGATQHTTIQQREAAAGQRPATKHARKTPTRRQRGRRRTAVVVVVILLLGLLTGWGAWYLTVGRYHQVPNLTGQAQSGAVQQLRNDGFTVDPAVQQAYSETVPSGAVVGTHPDAGSHLLGGKPVQLVVSKGKERYSVPAVVGKTYGQATQAFSGQPVQLKRSDIADDTGKIPAGTVIRTNPVAATQVKRAATITIYVSSGPPMVGMPNVAGQTQSDASSTLSQASFTVTVSQAFSDKVPSGSVISQSPAGNASVRKFSTVNLVVSKGPPTVTIPDIPKGSDPGDAAQALQALGLQVQIVRKNKGLFDFSGYKVDSLNPPAGTVVQRGSTVTMTVK